MVVKRVMRLEPKAENPVRHREQQMLNHVYRKPLAGELVDGDKSAAAPALERRLRERAASGTRPAMLSQALR